MIPFMLDAYSQLGYESLLCCCLSEREAVRPCNSAYLRTADCRLQGNGGLKAGMTMDGILARDLQLRPSSKFAYLLEAAAHKGCPAGRLRPVLQAAHPAGRQRQQVCQKVCNHLCFASRASQCNGTADCVPPLLRTVSLHAL